MTGGGEGAHEDSGARVAGDGKGAAAHPLPDQATCRELLETMALIRRFEEEAGRQYQQAKAGGFLHLAIGEEATIVGTTSVMHPDDYLIGTYRTHGHAIARGTDPKRVMAELFGREDGCSRGRGGSMHIFDLERRFMGGYGIVGGNLPIAAGLALACDYTGSDSVTVCMFGDGASNTGNFGETMNLAALWKLPVVFLVENNLYGMGTAIERHSAVTDLSRKAEGLGVAGVRVDGMDVLAVRETVAEHIRIAREDRQPTLVEAFTYRYRGHSAADPEVYRTKEEVEEWRQKDPVKVFRDRLLADGVISEDYLEELRERLERQIMEAVDFADNSPEPPLESLYDHLYVVGDQVRGWYAVDERTPSPHPGEQEREVGAGGAANWRKPARPTPDSGPGRGDAGGHATTRRTSADDGRALEGAGALPLMRMREALNQALAEEMRAGRERLHHGRGRRGLPGRIQGHRRPARRVRRKARPRHADLGEHDRGHRRGRGDGGAAACGRADDRQLLAPGHGSDRQPHGAIPYMFNGQVRVPLVVRMPGGGGHQLGPTHSHSLEAMFQQVPGLLVASLHPRRRQGPVEGGDPGRQPGDLHRARDPVRHPRRGSRDDGDHILNFGEAVVLREGGDLTIVAILRMVDVAEKAAKTLSHEHGAEAEVIDPRTLRPLDLDTILDSVRKTNRCVIVEEGWPHGGVGANLAALIQEQAFDHLDAPIQRVTGADVPMPYAKRLEQAAIPHPEHVVSAALATLEGSAVVAQDIVMPRLSDSMEEGTILHWLKSAGDEVSLGRGAGRDRDRQGEHGLRGPRRRDLIEILAQEGDTLPIGQVIARVGEVGEKPSGDGARRNENPKPPRTHRAEVARRPHAAEAPPPAAAAERETVGSRPLRWRGGSRARKGSTWRRSRARGRAVGS